MMLLVICGLVGITIGLLIFALMPRTNAVHDRVAQLAGSTSHSARRMNVFEQIYDAKSKSKMQQQLQEAGWYDISPARMGFTSTCSLIVGIAITVFLITVVKPQGIAWLASLLPAIIGLKAPDIILKRAISERKATIQCELPDFIDMLSTTVAAGIALNGALLSAVEMCTGPLAAEFEATLSDIRMGRSRSAALNAMASRVNQIDLSQMVTAIVQSERVGGNLSQVLEELAGESRERRLMRAEEIAGMLPVKMTIPMAFLLLPALFVIIMGPVLMNVVF